MEKLLPMSAFFKLLQDPINDGFGIRYRKVDGAAGEKVDCRKSRKRLEGKFSNRAAGRKGAGLRYDVFEKGVVLLEDEKGELFSIRNRLITHYRFTGQPDWHRIKRTW